MKHVLKIMRTTLFLLFFCVLFSSASNSYSQKITIKSGTTSIKEVCEEIEKNSDYIFVFSDESEKVLEKKVQVDTNLKEVKEILDAIFSDTDFTYKILDKQIVVYESSEQTLPIATKQLDIDAKQQSAKRQVTGKVVGEYGEPIIGANIVEIGTTNGTITDVNGNFSLNVENHAIIHVSYIGYLDQSIATAGQSTINITLSEVTKTLDEVVVVGYGTQKKKTLSGSISSLNEKEINTTVHSNLAQSIQGKVAGLHVRQSSGEPGAFDTNISIRGFGTPLYIIDGVQMPLDRGADEFQRLNPYDIESISFLKDASAAIFGRNGSNGAIIVTTKKGDKGRAKFSYDGAYGIQQPTGMPKMADRTQWAQMYNEAQINANYISNGILVPYYTEEQLEKEMTAPSTDWYGLVYRNRSTQAQSNITASGGSEIMTYYTSVGYVRDNGLLRSGDINYEQYSLRANMTMNLTKYFRAEVITAGRYDTQNSPLARQHNIFYGTRTALPGSPVYANNDPQYLANQQYLHPLAISESERSGYQQIKNKYTSGSISLTYNAPFLPGLSFKAMASYTNTNIMEKSLAKSYKLYVYNEGEDNPYVSIDKGSPSRIINGNNNLDKTNLQGYITYSDTIFNDHKIDASIIYEYDNYSDRWSTLSREYDFYTLDQVRYGSEDNQKNDGIEDDRLTSSFVGRFNYDFRQKYLLEFAFRYEGSYRYHPDIRWQFFPILSLGWRISEEKFAQNINWLSNLKLRMSYGKAGSDRGTPHQYIDGYILGGGLGYAFTEGTWTQGIAMPQLLNKKLTWSTSTTWDIGCDIGILDNCLSLEFDVFQRDNTGELGTQLLSVPNTAGFNLPQMNINHSRNQGFETSLGYNNHIGNFFYGIRGNFTFTRSKWIYYERGDFANSFDKWRNGINNRWSDFTWGYVVDEQFQNDNEILYAPIQNGVNGNTLTLPGDYRYKDVNGDGIINNLDMVPSFYSGNPKLHYGVTLNGSWKNIDFSLLFQGSGKYTVRFSEVYAEVLAFELNTPAYFFDRWHREDMYNLDSKWVPGKWPSTRAVTYAGANYHESGIWRKDASYIRFKNVEIGYTFPRKLTTSLGIENLRFYITGQNLLTICDPFVKPFDPEKIEGINNSGFTYPVMKSLNFSVNINF